MIDQQMRVANLPGAPAEEEPSPAEIAPPREAAPPAPGAHADNGHHPAQNDQNYSPSASATQPLPGPPKSILREYFESAVVTVIMALYGMTFIVQAVKVPTGSMQNTILIGDHLLVNKFIFAPGPHLPFLPQREIERGDIIVFKYPGNKKNPGEDIDSNSPPYVTNYVKRVIGLPGEHVEVRGARVYVNGELLPDHRVPAEETAQLAPLEILSDTPRADDEEHAAFYTSTLIDSGPDGPAETVVDVPLGHYFVMGDNRDNSSDSRAWGFVPRELIIGRAMFVYWSFDESAEPGNIFLDFINHTRWARTGTMIK
jgi:signal peptidase I